MASDPRDPRSILNSMKVPQDAMNTATGKMMEQMQVEVEQRKKKQMYDNLLDAFKYSADEPWGRPVPTEEPSLGQAIRDKIAEHKRMIAALEWFAAHISLDDPKDNALVGRVVLEGLRALNERNIR